MTTSSERSPSAAVVPFSPSVKFKVGDNGDDEDVFKETTLLESELLIAAVVASSAEFAMVVFSPLVGWIVMAGTGSVVALVKLVAEVALVAEEVGAGNKVVTATAGLLITELVVT